MKKILTIFTTLLVIFVQLQADYLEDGFLNPPNEAKPQVWWHWMNGNITKDGIKKDIEAMHQVGIGGFTILDVNQRIPAGEVKVLTPEWYDMVQYAIEIAAKYGMEVNFHNTPGWSSSGGPWIKKEDAMKIISYSQARIKGGKTISIQLPQPEKRLDFYREIAVVAFPSIKGDDRDFINAKPVLSTNITENVDLKKLLNNSKAQVVYFPQKPINGQVNNIFVEFEQAFEAGHAEIQLLGMVNVGAKVNIYTSQDGVNYKKIVNAYTLCGSTNFISFPTTHAKYFKFEFFAIAREIMPMVKLSLGKGQRIDNTFGKALFTNHKYFKYSAEPEKESIINPGSVIDISQYMDKNGKLTWDAPAGDWTIIRFGYTLTGIKNRPANPTGEGLECDKLSKKGVQASWDGMMKQIVDNAGDLAGTTVKGTFVDSYEVGMQNWTDTFREDFKRLRGYDPILLMPIITGRFIKSADYSERFLNDFRRTVADLFAENYAEYFSQLCHKANLNFYTESYGGPYDQLLQGRYADVPMGEFWVNTNSTNNAQMAGNLAQLYGRKFASTESFSATNTSGRWQTHPAICKIQGDMAYVAGINRLVFHSYAHQPWDFDTPGVTMGRWGFHFNRHNTLWNNFSDWITYLSRSQFMLQQGQVVSDILFIANENAPTPSTIDSTAPAAKGHLEMENSVPNGYHANEIDPKSFRELVEVKNGKIIMPDGLEFSLLVAKNTKLTHVEQLEKLYDLANNGANILLGDRTSMIFGLTDYPDADAKVKKFVTQLWGDLNGKDKTVRKIGKGQVFYGISIEEAMKKLNVERDFEVISTNILNHNIKYLHRTDKKGADWYFVANSSSLPVELIVSFKINDRIPELWDAENGKFYNAPIYQLKNNRIELKLSLAAAQSLFVVFREKFTPAEFIDATWSNNFGRENNKGSLVITKAIFAAKNGKASKDVTKIIQDKVISNKILTFSVNKVELGGDPAPGHPKELTLEYTLQGKNYKKVYAEFSKVSVIDNINSPLQIIKATYQTVDETKSLDVTDLIQNFVAPNGTVSFIVDRTTLNCAPWPGIRKKLQIEYSYNGQKYSTVYPEFKEVVLPEIIEPDYELGSNDGKLLLIAWKNGVLKLDSKNGSKVVTVNNLQTPNILNGDWNVEFQAERGAPASVVFKDLISYTEHADEGIKYFSGTATYSKKFNLSASEAKKQIILDLGKVMVHARVFVNGKECGLLWKMPYRMNITDYIHAGENELKIDVTNQWVNRLIGDENLEPDAEWNAEGSLTEWPEWFVKGEKSPTGRIAFTTWKLWKKGDSLLPAGLLGPVKLYFGEEIIIE